MQENAKVIGMDEDLMQRVIDDFCIRWKLVEQSQTVQQAQFSEQPQPPVRPKHGRFMSAHERMDVAERMTRYWAARRKAEKGKAEIKRCHAADALKAAIARNR
jgi:hypothetical protein